MTEKVKKWYNHLQTMKENIQTSYRYFNDRTLIDFIDDSSKRFNGYKPPRSGKDDWQAHVFSNVTRNKTIALFAKMGVSRPDIKIKVIPKNNLANKRLSDVVYDMYKYSEIKSNEDMAYFFETLEAAVKGTVITFEGYKSQYRKIKEIKSYDHLTGEVDFEEKEITEFNDCFSEICRLQDVFIWNPYESDIQKQARIIWKKEIPIDEFRFIFSKYSKMNQVKANNELSADELESFYGQDWSRELESNMVEIIYCFDKGLDEYVIIANGVEIQNSPFPWKHKRYPFAKTVFEPFDSKFFWGNSLPNKMMDDQDVLNALYNMALDKTYLSIHPPILDSTINEIEDELLVPGRRMPVEDTNSMKELKISSVDVSHFNMLQLVSRNLDLSSVSEISQGQAGSGSTAREVILAEENARRLMGLFNMFMEDLVYQKAKLRVPNILQFYTIPERIEETIDEEGRVSLRSAYREIRLESVFLEEGKIGTRVIRLTDSAPATMMERLKAGSRLGEEEAKFARTEGQSLHLKEVPASYIRNLDVNLLLVKESGYQRSKATEMAFELEYIKYVSTLFPDISNKLALFTELNRIYEKDPEKFLNEGGGQPQGQPQEMAGRGMGQTEMVRNLAGRNAGGGLPQGAGGVNLGDLSGV